MRLALAVVCVALLLQSAVHATQVVSRDQHADDDAAFEFARFAERFSGSSSESSSNSSESSGSSSGSLSSHSSSGSSSSGSGSGSSSSWESSSSDAPHSSSSSSWSSSSLGSSASSESSEESGDSDFKDELAENMKKVSEDDNPDKDTELQEALQSVKDNIVYKANLIKQEKRWVKAVTKIVEDYVKKARRVNAHIRHLAQEVKVLFRKKKQIENMIVQRKLTQKLVVAKKDLDTINSALRNVYKKQMAFNRSKIDIKQTIGAMTEELKKLRGEHHIGSLSSSSSSLSHSHSHHPSSHSSSSEESSSQY